MEVGGSPETDGGEQRKLGRVQRRLQLDGMEEIANGLLLELHGNEVVDDVGDAVDGKRRRVVSVEGWR